MEAKDCFETSSQRPPPHVTSSLGKKRGNHLGQPSSSMQAKACQDEPMGSRSCSSQARKNAKRMEIKWEIKTQRQSELPSKNGKNKSTS